MSKAPKKVTKTSAKNAKTGTTAGPQPASPSAPTVLHDFLTEGLLSVEGDTGARTRVTLPGLLARLSQGIATELCALQAHQQHPLHAFLVQLAAIALERGGEAALAHDEARWRALLIAAAAADGGGPEAFALVVGDLAKPAFLQPPVPEGTLAVLKAEHALPSEDLDVQITAKNHDVKVHPIVRPTPEHWLFALMTLQTTQGFLGRGNYGIARMNGGFSSRPCVAFAGDMSAAARFVRDVELLRAARPGLLSRYKENGKALLWCVRWDGATSLPLHSLDPYFIEVCRRVRLRVDPTAVGGLVAQRGSSDAPRVDVGESAGSTGDAWTPVATKDGKALTLPEAGFTTDRVRTFLFPDGAWAHGAAGAVRPDGADRYFVGQVLVRGQGKTGGYHERWVPVPAKARRLFARPETRATLGKRAADWIALAGTVRLKVLKPALLTLLQGGPEKLKFDDDRADAFLARFERNLDREFFPLLFEHAATAPEAADTAFEETLFELAKGEFERAVGGVPLPAARRPRAIAYAERAFHGAARNQLKRAFPPKEQGASA